VASAVTKKKSATRNTATRNARALAVEVAAWVVTAVEAFAEEGISVDPEEGTPEADRTCSIRQVSLSRWKVYLFRSCA
jgi:hypothetical protein